MEMGVSNITLAIDDALLRQIKVIAAQHDTSINSIVRDYFSHLANTGLQEKDVMNGNLQTLFNYSIGRIGWGQAKKILGIEDMTLTIMLREAGFPPPRASLEQETAMLEEIKDIHFEL